MSNQIVNHRTELPLSTKDYLKRYSAIRKIAAWRWKVGEIVSLEIYHWKMFILGQIPGKIGSFIRKKT